MNASLAVLRSLVASVSNADGVCASARCSGLVCADGQVCIEGICEPDPCSGLECEDFEACVLGECLPDPCRYIDCPELERCELVYGAAQCVADWVGQMSAEPEEINTDFEFREPPMVVEETAGEETAIEAGEEAGAGTTMEQEAGESSAGAEEKSGCDQRGRGERIPLTLLLLTFMWAPLRSRRVV